MNCLECLELLQKRLDGIVPQQEFGSETSRGVLEQHLSECPTCRDQYAAAQRLAEGMAQLPRATLSADFARTMAADVMADRWHRREKLRRRVYVTMALAASVLLTLLAAYWWFPQDRHIEPAPKDRLVKHEPAPQPPKIEKQTPIVPKKQETKTALAALTDRVADTTRDHAKVVLAAANLDSVENLPGVNEIPMLDPSVREAGQEVSDGVRTVTRSARRALDFFAREIPMPEIGEAKN